MQKVIKVIIGNDHRGFELKKQVVEFLRTKKIDVVDVGQFDAVRPADDMPVPPLIDVVKKVTAAVLCKQADFGILICSNGIGMSIASNRFCGIRAALCRTTGNVIEARQHNDANVLCMGADNVTAEEAKKITELFLETKPLGDLRYVRRRELFDKITKNNKIYLDIHE